MSTPGLHKTSLRSPGRASQKTTPAGWYAASGTAHRWRGKEWSERSVCGAFVRQVHWHLVSERARTVRFCEACREGKNPKAAADAGAKRLEALAKTIPRRATLDRQRRACGKPRCVCAGGGGAMHGPYWYAFWKEGGKTRSAYVGSDARLGKLLTLREDLAGAKGRALADVDEGFELDAYELRGVHKARRRPLWRPR